MFYGNVLYLKASSIKVVINKREASLYNNFDCFMLIR